MLYEALTGKRAFARDTAPETMTAILRDDPPDQDVATACALSHVRRLDGRGPVKTPIGLDTFLGQNVEALAVVYSWQRWMAEGVDGLVGDANPDDGSQLRVL